MHNVLMAPTVDLNELLVFARVVEAGSFSEAARRLDMPKSSVSKKVSDLEARLGTRLLQRTTRRLALTDAGRIYFERSARIISAVEEAEDAVAELQESPRGRLRVTVPQSLGMLGPVVARFLADHPEVQLEVICTDRRVDLVRDGFDLGVRAGPLHDSSLIAKRLGTMKRVLVASPAYVRMRGRPRSADDLAQHACITFGGGATPNVWSLQFEEQRRDVRVEPRLAVNDFEMMLDAARADAGIAWVPDFLAAQEIRARRLLNVLPQWCSIDIPVHAVYPTSRHLSPKVVRFIEALGQTFRSSPT
jgi:DNA-binding transcriptional LysR family regulator